jgi:hypothetical protein
MQKDVSRKSAAQNIDLTTTYSSYSCYPAEGEEKRATAGSPPSPVMARVRRGCLLARMPHAPLLGSRERLRAAGTPPVPARGRPRPRRRRGTTSPAAHPGAAGGAAGGMDRTTRTCSARPLVRASAKASGVRPAGSGSGRPKKPPPRARRKELGKHEPAPDGMLLPRKVGRSSPDRMRSLGPARSSSPSPQASSRSRSCVRSWPAVRRPTPPASPTRSALLPPPRALPSRTRRGPCPPPRGVGAAVACPGRRPPRRALRDGPGAGGRRRAGSRSDQGPSKRRRGGAPQASVPRGRRRPAEALQRGREERSGGGGARKSRAPDSRLCDNQWSVRLAFSREAWSAPSFHSHSHDGSYRIANSTSSGNQRPIS